MDPGPGGGRHLHDYDYLDQRAASPESGLSAWVDSPLAAARLAIVKEPNEEKV